MADLKTLSLELLLHIANTLNLSMQSLTAVIGLLNEGGTVPFIARYRKEATGNLDEVQIRDIEEKLSYFRELVSRRETILSSIQEQGKLTDELKARIEATLDRAELEDLYLPYRPKRRTKATIARDRGLGPLADYLWAQQATGAAAAGVCRDVCRRREGGADDRGGARGRAAHCRRDDQRGRRPAQGAAYGDARRRRHRVQEVAGRGR